jgi:hypothetical protein
MSRRPITIRQLSKLIVTPEADLVSRLQQVGANVSNARQVVPFSVLLDALSGKEVARLSARGINLAETVWRPAKGLQIVTTDDIPSPPNVRLRRQETDEPLTSDRVVIAQGHKAEQQRVAECVQSLGLQALVLNDENGNLSVIEQFDSLPAVAFAVLLFCPEPRAAVARRPMQRFLFQLGFIVARMGVRRVAVLGSPRAKAPADLSPLRWIVLDKRGTWSRYLFREFFECGLPVSSAPV